MRVVGGRLGGRRFEGPPGSRTRPTPERVREALASALQAREALQGAAVLDLFAGSGALSFEALSRGASHALLVDHDQQMVRATARAARSLGLAESVRVMRFDLIRSPAAAAGRITRSADAPFDLVFADPPYRAVDSVPALLGELINRGCLSPGALVAVEHSSARPPAALPGFTRLDDYRYGDTSVLLVRLG